MNKCSFKIAAIFSILVFLILILTMFFIGFFAVLLFHLGIVKTQKISVLFFIFAITSILIGTIISKIVGKRPIHMIIEISEATKEVAKGNFDIRLNENPYASELYTMTHNFNLMIKELANTEMFRNDFIENVSHEFKTPLAAIEGYVTLLQNKSLSEQKRMEYTQKILYNTKRLSSLTGNILLLSRLEHQEIDTQKERYSLDEQLREVILLFEDQWNTKQLELDIELDSIDYYGNRILLSQVWQNILGNAMKFVSDHGQIWISLHQKEGSIVISITDDGIGMSPDVMQRIYEKFYQGDPSRAASGNGLGLTLAKRIVDLHEGTITASSKEGEGTTFTVSLPVV